MNKKNKIRIGIIGLLITLTAIVGLTYAYYLTKIIGNPDTKTVKSKTTKLELVYSDNSDEILSSSEPLGPKVGTETIDAIGTKNFTVTNNGDDSNYVVTIENVKVTNALDGTPTNFETNDFRYTLSCNIISSDEQRNGKECNSVNDILTFPINGGILTSNNIFQDDIHTYTLTMWYIDNGLDQSNDMGKQLQAKINISDISYKNPFKSDDLGADLTNLAYNIVQNAITEKNGTHLTNAPLSQVAKTPSLSSYGKSEPTSYPSTTKANQNNIYTYASDFTINSSGAFTLINPKSIKYSDGYEELKGKYIVQYSGSPSASNANNIYAIYKVSPTEVYKDSFKFVQINPYISNEKVLTVAEDDYGTSYYFRGGVTDNYVNFAGMCWRIVRIVGDGSIKLILDDQYTTCDDNELNETKEVYTGDWQIGNGNYGRKVYSSNSLTSSDGYVNEDIKYFASYLNADEKESSMASSFKNFQNKFTSEELDRLKSGDWCLGDATDATSYIKKTEAFDKKIKTKSFNYSSPNTLNCIGTKISTWEDNVTPMFVGTTTYQEVLFAGATMDTGNYTFYLINDFHRNSRYFYTLSLYNYNYNSDTIMIVRGNGAVKHQNLISESTAYFRPAIHLKANTIISSGDGTQKNPYVIS